MNDTCKPVPEKQLLRNFVAEVKRRLRGEMLHKFGASGRTARFVMLTRDLLEQLGSITCVVYGCEFTQSFDSFPTMCAYHRESVMTHDEPDINLAALLVAGWPLPPMVEAVPDA